MKLRLRQNSLRLRLTQTEVKTLIETGLLEEAVEFAPTPLIYSLRLEADIQELEASFHDGWLMVAMPEAAAKAWAGGTQTGLEGVSGRLSILVEKDWACVYGAPEENEDTFPRP